MKFAVSFLTLACSLLCTTVHAQAAQPSPSTGVLRFVGAVVMPTCVMSTTSRPQTMASKTSVCGGMTLTQASIKDAVVTGEILLVNYD